MFRRPQKGPEHEGNVYTEEKKMNPYSYNKEPQEKELPPRMFDNPQKSNPLKNNTNRENWSEKSSVPHHFQEIVKEEEPETTLGAGVHVTGELKFERLLKIDGLFEGELISKGKVIIGTKGHVKANLNLKEAVIEGRVEGNINCEDRVELRGSASVHGDIKTKSLVIDEGVVINGHVNICSSETN